MLRRHYLIALLVLGGMTFPAYGQVKLEWKFQEGEKFYEETENSITQVMRTAGTETKESLVRIFVVSFTVRQKNPDGSVVIERKIESIKTKTPGGTEVTDDPLRHLQGATFKITLSPKMQVIKFEGYDDLVRRMSNNDPVIAKVIRQQMPEEDLRSDMERHLFTFLPDMPVRPGGKWKHESPVPLGAFGSLKAVYQYTYEGKSKLDGREVEKITFTASATHVPPKPKEGDPVKVVKSNVKVDKIGGTIHFDAEAGKLVQSETTTHVKGALTVSVMGGNFDQELVSDQTIKIRVLKENPLKK